MNWIKVHLLTLALATALFLVASAALADRWVWLQLCRHKTGELVERYKHDGRETYGRMFTNASQVTGIIPLKNDKCVMVEFRNGPPVVVGGTLREVACLVRGGVECEAGD